jgi:hypothetical protein
LGSILDNGGAKYQRRLLKNETLQTHRDEKQKGKAVGGAQF